MRESLCQERVGLPELVMCLGETKRCCLAVLKRFVPALLAQENLRATESCRALSIDAFNLLKVVTSAANILRAA